MIKNSFLVKILTILLIAFILVICFCNLSYAQNDITEEDIEELVNSLLNLDTQSLDFISQLLGIDFSNSNKEQLIIDITRFIRDNVNVIGNSNNEGEYISISLNFGNDLLKAEVGYYFKKKVKVESIEYTQYIFINCKIEYNEYLVSSDILVINDKNNDENFSLSNIELMASGNSYFKVKNYLFQAEKVFVYFDTKQALLYDVIIYLPDIVPFIFEAETVKVLSVKEIIATGVRLFSDNNIYFPHYEVNIETMWIYPDIKKMSYSDVFASNITFKIGQTIFLYFPFLFQSQFSSGIHLNLQYEKSLGFIFQTTTPFLLWGFSNAFIIDYYQKMGLYFSLANEIDIFSLLKIKIAGAYDRAVRYIGKGINHWGELSNAVDINNDGLENETFNSLRYYFSLDFPLTIYKGKSVDLEKRIKKTGDLSFLDMFLTPKIKTFGQLMMMYIDNLNMGIDIDFFKISDPIFQEQFMDFPRKEIFELTEVLYREKNIILYIPDVPGISLDAMKIDAKFYFSTFGLDIGFSGNWVWSFKSNEGQLNPYDVLKFYGIQIKNITFPYFWIKTSPIISNNIIDDILKVIVKVFNPDYEFTSLSNTISGLEISLPIGFKFNFKTITKQTFVEDDTKIKPISDKSQIDNVGDISLDATIDEVYFYYDLPLTIYYDFVFFKIGYSYELVYNYVHTRIALNENPEDIKISDDENTKFKWEWKFYSSLYFNFFKDYEYLKLSFGADISCEMNGFFDDFAYKIGFKDEETGESIITDNGGVLTFNKIFLKFFKSELTLTGLNIPLLLNDEDKEQLGNIIYISNSDGEIIPILIDKKYLLEKKREEYYNLELKMNFIKNFTLSIYYKEINRLNYQDYANGGRWETIRKFGYPSIFGGKGDSIKFDLKYISNDKYLLFNSILIENLGLNVILNHYFNKNKVYHDSLNISFLIDFSISNLWNIRLIYEIENNNIARYFLGSNPRNFFLDLWWSISFWDTECLLKTYWKAKSILLVINHNLAEWSLTVTLKLSPKYINDALALLPSLSITITLIDFPDLSGGEDGSGKINTLIYDRF